MRKLACIIMFFMVCSLSFAEGPKDRKKRNREMPKEQMVAENVAAKHRKQVKKLLKRQDRSMKHFGKEKRKKDMRKMKVLKRKHENYQKMVHREMKKRERKTKQKSRDYQGDERAFTPKR